MFVSLYRNNLILLMKLFYRKYGEIGPPLIIVHGLYGMSDNWLSVAKELSSYFCVYCIDQRNHGRSPHSPIHNYDAMVDDLKEFLSDHNIEKAILLGHSMGGKTVMSYAVRYPETVSNLIVVDISPKKYILSGQISETTNHYKILDTLGKTNVAEFSSREAIQNNLIKELNDQRLVSFLMKNIRRNNEKQFYWALNIDALQQNILSVVDGLEDVFTSQVYGFPTLFIRGLKSNYITDDDISFIRKLFPYADIVDVPDAGHWVHAEQHDVFVHAVKTFLIE